MTTSVRVEVLEECYAERDCSSEWSLDLVEGRWGYLCRRHQVAVPLSHGVRAECSGRARLQPGVHEIPAVLAESLVSKQLAQFVQGKPVRPAAGKFNQALKRAGLPEITAEDQDFMRQVVTAKRKISERPPSKPSPIEGLSNGELSEMQDLLKGMRDRK